MALATCNYLVQAADTTTTLSIVGNASYVNCGAMRAFFNELVSGDKNTELTIDFARCQALDSTALGLIAKVAMDLASKPQAGRVTLANLDGRNRELVENLGLHHVCVIAGSAGPISAAQAAPLPAAMCQNDCLLEAHEALVRADPDNAPRFRDVIESLKSL